MSEFYRLVQPYLVKFFPSLISDVVIFIITMAIVYCVGRMLLLTKSDKIKNSIALVSILACNYYTQLQTINQESIINMVVHSSIGILLYVLLGFRLFDRVDSFLDKHFGKDKIRRK